MNKCLNCWSITQTMASEDLEHAHESCGLLLLCIGFLLFFKYESRSTV